MGARGPQPRHDKDDVYEVAARAYRDGASMSLAIAAEFDMTESAARAWVIRLRHAGYPLPMVRSDKVIKDAPAPMPLRLVEREPWMEDRACVGVPVGVFFPERGHDSSVAKAICATCPVCEECLDYALRNCEKYGIWGGTSERERRTMRRHINGERAELYRAAIRGDVA